MHRQPHLEDLQILCPGCPHRSVYYVLNKLKMHAAGDIGCYTLGAVAPLECCRYNDLYGCKYFQSSWNGESKRQKNILRTG